MVTLIIRFLKIKQVLLIPRIKCIPPSNKLMHVAKNLEKKLIEMLKHMDVKIYLHAEAQENLLAR